MTMRILAGAAFVVLLSTAACDSNNNNSNPDLTQMPNDMSAGQDMYPANYDVDMQCYNDPKTHNELINSCAAGIERIDKNPTLPLLNPDGTRPPLP